MLKKEFRLKKDENFRRVFKLSRPVYFNGFVFRSSKNKETVSRFGFVISAKTEKLAVRRNAMRRALQQAAKENFGKILPGYDIVIIVKGKIEYPVDREQIREVFLEGMKKLGLVAEQILNSKP